MYEFSFEELHGGDERILAAGRRVSNDARRTGLNNNDLVIGPSGAGKTRSYVKPNMLQCIESFIVTDTKGLLVHEIGPVLSKRGYRIEHIDFSDLASPLPGKAGKAIETGYNPLDFIRVDPIAKTVDEQDVMSVANALCPIEDSKDPFWERAACMYIAALTAYVMECLPERERTLSSVEKLAAELGTEIIDILFDELSVIDPESLAVRKWSSFRATKTAEKMHASICGIVAEKLDPLAFDGTDRLYEAKRRIDFARLGEERTAVFLTVSDTDRSLDRLIGLFYLQAFQELCRHADRHCEEGRLPIPVRFYLDDFASGCAIEDFDNIVSIIRSRNIAASIVLQSITQLESLYGKARATTIANNCDHWLYLGGQDLETARLIGAKMGADAETILAMPLGRACLLERGRRGQAVYPFDLASHELYAETPEAAMRREAAIGANCEMRRCAGF